jgi:hypothetical protein
VNACNFGFKGLAVLYVKRCFNALAFNAEVIMKVNNLEEGCSAMYISRMLQHFETSS